MNQNSSPPTTLAEARAMAGRNEPLPESFYIDQNGDVQWKLPMTGTGEGQQHADIYLSRDAVSQTTEHTLKVWPAYWDAIASGVKSFEVRRDDRGFQRGDVLRLRPFNPQYHCFTEPYSGIKKRITYILTGGQFGIEPGYVVMGLEDV